MKQKFLITLFLLSPLTFHFSLLRPSLPVASAVSKCLK